MISIVQDVSIFVALAHGILAFFSPCVLPLIPGFLGVLIAGERNFSKLLGFFAGFTALFTILGAFSSILGSVFSKVSGYLEIFLGAAITIFGVLYIFDVKIVNNPSLNVWKYKGSGFLNGLLLGSAIGLVWIPCSSPVLGSILAIATQKSVAKGSLLLFVYSLGISIPFFVIGGAISKLLTVSFGTPKWEKVLKIVGGLFIISLGFVIMFGLMKV